MKRPRRSRRRLRRLLTMRASYSAQNATIGLARSATTTRQRPAHSRSISATRRAAVGLDIAEAVRLRGQRDAARLRRNGGARVLAPVPAPAQHVARIGVDHFADLGRIVGVLARLGAHVDERVVGPREAEGEIAFGRIEIVAAETQLARQRNCVVEVDQRVDLRQRAARQHALDQPLDRRTVAGALDAEALVGGAPRGDAGNGGQLGPVPTYAAGLLGRRDLRRQRGAAALADAANLRRRPARRGNRGSGR